MAATFDDDQLRTLALKLTDPYDQAGLIFELPGDAELLDIINVYSFDRYPTEKVFCCVCRGRHHKRGFTALLQTGQRVLLGSKCGAEIFQQSWHEAEKRIDERADRQFELKKLDRLDRILPGFEQKLLGWQSPVAYLAGRRAAFDRQLGELASRAREAVLWRGGALTVHRKVENRAARAAGMTQVSDYQEVTVGQLLGGEFFNSLALETVVDGAVAALGAMRSGRGTGAFSTKQLRDRRRRFERSLEELEICAKVHAAAEDFFSLKNFRGLLKWANEHSATQARYIISDNGIVSQEGKPGGISIAPVPDIDTSLLDVIADYRRSD